MSQTGCGGLRRVVPWHACVPDESWLAGAAWKGTIELDDCRLDAPCDSTHRGARECTDPPCATLVNNRAFCGRRTNGNLLTFISCLAQGGSIISEELIRRNPAYAPDSGACNPCASRCSPPFLVHQPAMLCRLTAPGRHTTCKVKEAPSDQAVVAQQAGPSARGGEGAHIELRAFATLYRHTGISPAKPSGFQPLRHQWSQ